tara:strand:- start:9049 stop:9810 length:762 start_codon:yes stop_codon:yes gene_type:complete
MDISVLGPKLMMSCLNREAGTFIREFHALIPELVVCGETPGGDYHAENVLEHMIGALDAASGYHPILQLAALFHDVGKPAVASQKEGRLTFHNHEVVGEQIVKELFPRLGFNEKITQDVSHLVRHHMFRFTPESKDKALRHWLLRVGPDWYDLLLLRLADRRGNRAKQDKAPFTSQMNGLATRVNRVIGENPVVFETDLDITREEIKQLAEDVDEIIPALVGLTNNEPEKNDNVWLKEYIKRVYATPSDSPVS